MEVTDNEWRPATDKVEKAIANNEEAVEYYGEGAGDSVEARYVLLVGDVRSVGDQVGTSTVSAGAIQTASFEVGLVQPGEVTVIGYAEGLAPVSMQPTDADKETVLGSLLPKRFSVRLSGNTVYALNVDWDEDDIADVDLETPGTYTVEGTLQQPDGVTLVFDNGVSDTITRTIIVEERKTQGSGDIPGDDTETIIIIGYAEPFPTANLQPTGADKNTVLLSLLPAGFPVYKLGGELCVLDVAWNAENVVNVDLLTPGSYLIRGTLQVPDSTRLEFAEGVGDTILFALCVESVTPVIPETLSSSGSSSRPFRPSGSSSNKTEDAKPQKPVAEPENTPQETTPELPATTETKPSAETFRDVAGSDWFAPAVSWVSARGVMSGYSSGLFGANDAVTREQLAVTLYRYAQARGYSVSGVAELSDFTDGGSVSDWAAEAVRWAVANGLLSDKSGMRLDAQGTATRAEIASILMRFCEMTGR